VQRALQSVHGVVRVNTSDTRGDVSSFDVDSEKGADVRRDVAAAVVRGGWGLLELRPMRMSLEDIFLSLTTEELATEDAHMEAALPSEPAAGSEGGANA
jgi:ABC-2 type transport system ATP-binding protein